MSKIILVNKDRIELLYLDNTAKIHNGMAFEKRYINLETNEIYYVNLDDALYVVNDEMYYFNFFEYAHKEANLAVVRLKDLYISNIDNDYAFLYITDNYNYMFHGRKHRLALNLENNKAYFIDEEYNVLNKNQNIKNETEQLFDFDDKLTYVDLSRLDVLELFKFKLLESVRAAVNKMGKDNIVAYIYELKKFIDAYRSAYSVLREKEIIHLNDLYVIKDNNNKINIVTEDNQIINNNYIISNNDIIYKKSLKDFVANISNEIDLFSVYKNYQLTDYEEVYNYSKVIPNINWEQKEELVIFNEYLNELSLSLKEEDTINIDNLYVYINIDSNEVILTTKENISGNIKGLTSLKDLLNYGKLNSSENSKLSYLLYFINTDKIIEINKSNEDVIYEIAKILLVEKIKQNNNISLVGNHLTLDRK